MQAGAGNRWLHAAPYASAWYKPWSGASAPPRSADAEEAGRKMARAAQAADPKADTWAASWLPERWRPQAGRQADGKKPTPPRTARKDDALVPTDKPAAAHSKLAPLTDAAAAAQRLVSNTVASATSAAGAALSSSKEAITQKSARVVSSGSDALKSAASAAASAASSAASAAAATAKSAVDPMKSARKAVRSSLKWGVGLVFAGLFFYGLGSAIPGAIARYAVESGRASLHAPVRVASPPPPQHPHEDA